LYFKGLIDLNNKEIWIEEKLEIKNGRALKVRITKSLEKIKSEFQEIEVVESQSFVAPLFQ
ncbi:unnamed protein product, partial [marine sediment metagenome]